MKTDTLTMSMTSGTDPVERLRRLQEEALLQSDEALAARRKLNDRFLREIEKEIQAALRMLRFLGDPWQHGDRTDYEVMRISLDKALTARKKERRDRLLQHWKEMLELNTRRLELLKESRALE